MNTAEQLDLCDVDQISSMHSAMGPHSTRTRKNDPDAVKARILDAAAELFQILGYSETTTDAIRREAKVSSGALHYHYPTKKHLGLAVVRERVAPAVEAAWIDLLANYYREPRKGDRNKDLIAQMKEMRKKFPDDIEVPSFAIKVVCAKCGARGRHIDVRPNWKEQPPTENLTGKVWR